MKREQEGRIPLPPVEVVELLDGEPALPYPASLRPRGGWLRRLLERERKDRFVLVPGRIPAALLGNREEFPLLEIDESRRPVLNVLPSMRGELRIGVCQMSVEQMLADPALAQSDESARLPLPYGARVRIECGPRIFVARVGGPPLVQSPDRRPASSAPLLARPRALAGVR